MTEQGQDRLAVVDTVTLITSLTVPLPDRPSGLAISNDGHNLYITHLLSKYITILPVPIHRLYLPFAGRSDQATKGSVFDSLPTLSTPSLYGDRLALWPNSNLVQSIVIAPDGERAYVPHTRSNSTNPALTLDTTVFPIVSLIDLRKGSIWSESS